jgi:hypothetical protein
MLQVLLCGCCKIRSRCCICCNSYTRMLQASVPNVSAVWNGCCTYFIWVLHMFHTYVVSVSSGCYICFHTYVASVSSRCCIYFAMATHMFPSCFNYFGRCKSRSDVALAHVCSGPICSSCQLLGPLACKRVWRGREQQAGNRAGADRDGADVGHGARRDIE